MSTMSAVHVNEAAAELSVARAITVDVQQELQMRRLPGGAAARVLTKAVGHMDAAAAAIAAASQICVVVEEGRGELSTSAPAAAPADAQELVDRVAALERSSAQAEQLARALGPYTDELTRHQLENLLGRVSRLEQDVGQKAGRCQAQQMEQGLAELADRLDVVCAAQRDKGSPLRVAELRDEFTTLAERVAQLEPDDQADVEIRDLIGWRHQLGDEVGALGGRVAQVEAAIRQVGAALVDATPPVT